MFRYTGHPEAERVAIVIGSAFEVLDETAAWLNAHGEKVGVLHVTLYRPWDAERFRAALPPTVTRIAVLDRTKEPGGPGEPLYLDVLTTFAEALAAGRISSMPVIVGGRYGLSSKDFDPAMAKTVFDELKKPEPKRGFTIGITDDVSHTSLAVDASFDIEPPDVVRALFFGLGADGTVGANKNSTKILASDPERHAQGYFVYDSKKSGSYTISHLRFGPRAIRAPYLLKSANFVGIHKFDFLYKLDTLAAAAPGATVLINSPYGPDDVWNEIPREVQQQIVDKKLKLHVIDASGVASGLGLGSRVNTILQTCFFALSGVMPRDKAIEAIKRATEKTYAKKGKAIVEKNFAAIDSAVANLHEVRVPAKAAGQRLRLALVPDTAPDFVRNVTAPILALRGDIASRQRASRGRHVSHRHDQVREAEYRRRGPGLGIRPLHPVRPVRHRLPAQRDSGQVLRREPARWRAAGLQGRAHQRARLSRLALHAAGLRRRLHRVRRLRGELSGAQRDRLRRQGDQHEGPARSISRPAARASASSRRCHGPTVRA